MVVYLIKITNKENVDNVFKRKIFTHQDIYNFETDIKAGAIVFIYLSGDKSQISWPQGLVGFGLVERGPYEKGYSDEKPRYFKIDIQPKFVLDNPLEPKFTKLHPVYQEQLYDVPYVGANHFPNQAIAKATGDGAKALLTLFRDINPDSFKDFDLPLLGFASEPVWEEFSRYLSGIGLQEKTVANYKSGVRSVCAWEKITIGELFNYSIGVLEDLLEKIRRDKRDINGNSMYSSALQKVIEFLVRDAEPQDVLRVASVINMPKPFMLIAGISGTGKSRYISEQAYLSSMKNNLENFELIPVRPDWHEPSDLLGYTTRINEEKFIISPFLKFIIQAWIDCLLKADQHEYELKRIQDIRPFWLCLDEMNLAPVEQYFADYLSVLETREWKNDEYWCAPILKSDAIMSLTTDAREQFWTDLGFNTEDVVHLGFRAFCEKEGQGIPIPPNLIVAGTVNMDETTHGFSRKVIDRALTIDFGEFFKNDFDDFLDQKLQPKPLGFSIHSHASEVIEQAIESGKQERHDLTTAFMKSINSILAGTAYEIAFRALNEIHLAVGCFKPESPEELRAVWDDFLMQKILPRIEGDTAKLRYSGEIDSKELSESLPESEFGRGSVLHALYALLKTEDLLGPIWPGDSDNNDLRPDLLRFREGKEDPLMIPCRTEKKLKWMMKRLKANHFTDFWV